jgi:hypothetical protein
MLVDCGSTSHIVNDESMFVSFDDDFDSNAHCIELADGSRKTCIVKGRGEVKVHNNKGEIYDGLLEIDCLYHPITKAHGQLCMLHMRADRGGYDICMFHICEQTGEGMTFACVTYASRQGRV